MLTGTLDKTVYLTPSSDPQFPRNLRRKGRTLNRVTRLLRLRRCTSPGTSPVDSGRGFRRRTENRPSVMVYGWHTYFGKVWKIDRVEGRLSWILLVGLMFNTLTYLIMTKFGDTVPHRKLYRYLFSTWIFTSWWYCFWNLWTSHNVSVFRHFFNKDLQTLSLVCNMPQHFKPLYQRSSLHLTSFYIGHLSHRSIPLWVLPITFTVLHIENQWVLFHVLLSLLDFFFDVIRGDRGQRERRQSQWSSVGVRFL